MALKRPPAATVDENAPHGTLYDIANNINAAAQSDPDLNAPVPHTLSSAGVLTPTSRTVAVLPFGGAASDNLDFIDVSGVDPGMAVWIELADAARPVTLRHLMDTGGATAYAGIELADADLPGDGLTIDDGKKAVKVQLLGGRWLQRDSRGFPPPAGIGLQDADFGGFAMVNARFGAVAKNPPYTLVRAEVLGRMVHAQTAGQWILPDPNDAAAPWQWGDTVPWSCDASSLTFQQWDGNPPANTANHDRAQGKGAKGMLYVNSNAVGGALFWELSGMTDTAPVVGGLVRTAKWQSYTDLTLADNINVQNVATFSHTAAAGEKWLYVINFASQGAGSNGGDAAKFLFNYNVGAADIVLAQTGRPRWSTGLERQALIATRIYSGAVTVTCKLDAQHSATGFSLTAYSPLIVALRLEADEQAWTDTTTHDEPTAGVYFDVMSNTTPSLPAGDYVLLASTVFNSSAAEIVDMQVLVDGTAYGQSSAGRVGAGLPYEYTALVPVTLTAAAHTIKLQGRRGAGATVLATFGPTHVCLLKEAAFAQVDKASALTASTNSSSAFANKISASWTLKTAYNTLLLGGMHFTLPGATQSAGPSTRLRRNAANLVTTGQFGTGVDASGPPAHFFAAAVVGPQLAADAFDLGFNSVDNASSMTCDDAALVALALGPS